MRVGNQGPRRGNRKEKKKRKNGQMWVKPGNQMQLRTRLEASVGVPAQTSTTGLGWQANPISLPVIQFRQRGIYSGLNPIRFKHKVCFNRIQLFPTIIITYFERSSREDNCRCNREHPRQLYNLKFIIVFTTAKK